MNTSKHTNTHERPFKCKFDNCENTKGFALDKDRERHYRTVHGTGTVSKCPDSQCGRHFTRTDNRDRHFQEQHSRS